MECLAANIRSVEGIGLEVNGIRKKVELYVDDTNLLLGDIVTEYPLVKPALDLYCAASNGRFHIDKTIVVSVGHIDQANYPTELPKPITRGETARHLGIPVGNAADPILTWTAKADSALQKARTARLNNITLLERITHIRTWIQPKIHYLLYYESIIHSRRGSS